LFKHWQGTCSGLGRQREAQWEVKSRQGTAQTRLEQHAAEVRGVAKSVLFVNETCSWKLNLPFRSSALGHDVKVGGRLITPRWQGIIANQQIANFFKPSRFRELTI
jgi:hypothetical protein